MIIRALATATGGTCPCTSAGWGSGSAAAARVTHCTARPGSPRAKQAHAAMTISSGRCSSSWVGNIATQRSLVG